MKRKKTQGPHHVGSVSLLGDPKVSHRRKQAEARLCLKQGIHTIDAIVALRAILAKPDRSMSVKALDMVRRALAIHTTPTLAHEEKMCLPARYKGLIGGVKDGRCAGQPVEWTTDSAAVARSMDKLK